MRVPLVFDAAFVLSRVRVVDGCCCLRQGVFGFCLRRWRRLCFGGARQGHNRTHAQPAQVLGLLVLPVIVLVVEMVYVWRKCSSDQDNPKKLLPLGLIIISQRSVRFARAVLCVCPGLGLTANSAVTLFLLLTSHAPLSTHTKNTAAREHRAARHAHGGPLAPLHRPGPYSPRTKQAARW